MKKLIYADTFSLGAFHETFNASSLMMFTQLYQHIVYYAPKESKLSVEKLIGKIPNNVQYKPILFVAGIGRIGNFFRYLSSTVWNVILALKQRHDEVLFFNYNSLWSLKIVNYICKRRKTDIIVACHGELENFLNGTKLNLPAQAGLNLFTNSNWEIAEKLHFCVLGKSILKNISNVVIAKHVPKFISFEHSFIPHRVEHHKIDNVLRIGTVGTIRKQKGLADILAIGKALSPIPNIEFYALGRITCNPDLLIKSDIKFIPGAEKNYVSKAILNRYIDTMDCLIFTYPIDRYKLTASGALFDAIDREKIIFSLHNDYFDEIFNMVDIGKLFDSVDEMIEYLKYTNIAVEFKQIDFLHNKEVLSYIGAAKKFSITLEQLQLI